MVGDVERALNLAGLPVRLHLGGNGVLVESFDWLLSVNPQRASHRRRYEREQAEKPKTERDEQTGSTIQREPYTFSPSTDGSVPGDQPEAPLNAHLEARLHRIEQALHALAALDPDESVCVTCGGLEGVHHDGCPQAPPVSGRCGFCGEEVALTDLRQHMVDVHDVDEDELPSQDQLEAMYVTAKEVAREMMERAENPFRGREAYPHITPRKIWAAIGYKTATGHWPHGFEPGEALLVAMDHLAEHCEELHGPGAES